MSGEAICRARGTLKKGFHIRRRVKRLPAKHQRGKPSFEAAAARLRAAVRVKYSIQFGLRHMGACRARAGSGLCRKLPLYEK